MNSKKDVEIKCPISNVNAQCIRAHLMGINTKQELCHG